MKFGYNRPSGFRREDIRNSERTYDDGQRSLPILSAPQEAFSSGCCCIVVLRPR